MSKKRFYFSPEQIEELTRDYATTLNKDLAERFGCPIYTVHGKAYRLGLKKDKAFLASVFRERSMNPNHGGRKTQFKKGQIPINKGKKQIEFMSQEAINRTKATRFKRGHTPKNYKPVGYERVNVEGYVEIKVADPNVFQLKHRVVWEKHFGTIPKGYNIQFKDGNRQNCNDINNLYMISRAKQLKNENSLHARYPEEITRLIQLKGALKRQINKQTQKEQE